MFFFFLFSFLLKRQLRLTGHTPPLARFAVHFFCPACRCLFPLGGAVFWRGCVSWPHGFLGCPGLALRPFFGCLPAGRLIFFVFCLFVVLRFFHTIEEQTRHCTWQWGHHFKVPLLVRTLTRIFSAGFFFSFFCLSRSLALSISLFFSLFFLLSCMTWWYLAAQETRRSMPITRLIITSAVLG